MRGFIRMVKLLFKMNVQQSSILASKKYGEGATNKKPESKSLLSSSLYNINKGKTNEKINKEITNKHK